MLDYYILIGLIYIIIGFFFALLYYFVLRKPLLGRFAGALVVAVVGSFFGGVIEYLFSDLIAFFTNFAGVVNVFPPIIVTVIFLHILSLAGGDKRKERDSKKE
jgi:hypothetical protein